MNIQDCLQLLREIKDVAFATVDEKGFPQVRIIDVMIVENEKVVFLYSKRQGFLQTDYIDRKSGHYGIK